MIIFCFLFNDQMEDATGEGIEDGVIREDPDDPLYPYGPINFGLGNHQLMYLFHSIDRGIIFYQNFFFLS